MSETVLLAANQAIFHMQLNTDEAIRYIVKQAKVSPKDAGLAIKHTLTSYKNKN